MESQHERGQNASTTLDGLLNRRVALEQPRAGYRVAVDTVLLAAAVPARAGQTALELGCGVGGAMLALAWRVPDMASLVGVELQPELARLCRANIARNGRDAVCVCEAGDVTHPHEAWRDRFDHVFANPPYHDAARHDASPMPGKRLANTEAEGDLSRWIGTALWALKSGGSLTMIHRADRLEAILEACRSGFGAVRVLPIAPRAGAAPSRSLVRAVKGGEAFVTTAAPFVLHEQGSNGFTDAADRILRDGDALIFQD